MMLTLFGPSGDRPTKRNPKGETLPATWADYVATLSSTDPVTCDCAPHTDCSQKDAGLGWSPIEFVNAYRNTANAVAVHALVYDLDDLTPQDLPALQANLEGLRHVVYSSHAHTAAKPALRVVLALTRSLTPAEYPRIWREVARVLQLSVGINVDKMCKDLGRWYYLPQHKIAETPILWIGEGEAISPADIVSSDQASKPTTAQAPITDDDIRKKIALLKLRKSKSKKDVDVIHHDLLERILSGDALAERGNRSNSVNLAATLIGYCLPIDTSIDSVVGLVSLSLLKIADETQSANLWVDVFRASYTRAQERKSFADAKTAEQNAEILRRLENRLPKPSADDLPIQDSLSDTLDEKWESLLLHGPDGKLKLHGENAYILLAFSPPTRGTIRFNELTKGVDVFGGPFDGVNHDVLVTECTDYLARFHSLYLNPHQVEPRLLRVAYQNAYDPLGDYLRALQWDGEDRLSGLLTDFALVNHESPSGADVSELARIVGHKWARSAVARALNPGCKVDTVLIFEGLQGKKKTTFFDVLGGEYFSSEPINLGDKDSKMLASRFWINELGELEALSKSRIEQQKQFFSQRVDNFRVPYGKVIQAFLRRCVFVGSTNNYRYLNDPTGNRRYWCFKLRDVGKADIDKLKQLRDQIWAQAVAEYYQYLAADEAGIKPDDNMYKWWLDDNEQTLMDFETAARTKESQYENRIIEWWVDQAPTARPAYVTTSQITDKVFRIPAERVTQAILTEIGQSLSSLGFRHVRKYDKLLCRQAWAYEPSDELRAMPRRGMRLLGVQNAAAAN